jgi:hypothetical protein
MDAPPGAPGVAGSVIDNCLTFQRVSDYAMPRMPFSANDVGLPNGAFTLAFFFRLFARRQPSSYNVLGVKLNNLFAPNTLPDGSLYVDMDDQSFQLPLTVDFGSGRWHHFATSFDATTGIVRAFVDGKQARLPGLRSMGNRSTCAHDVIQNVVGP